MRRIGWTVIHKNRNGGKPARCVNCGKKANSRVTFSDRYGKVTVALCKYCAQRDYVDLYLQTRFDWPEKK
jgi:transcription elongation factor Elf1